MPHSIDVLLADCTDVEVIVVGVVGLGDLLCGGLAELFVSLVIDSLVHLGLLYELLSKELVELIVDLRILLVPFIYA